MQRNGSFLTGFDNKNFFSENWNLFADFHYCIKAILVWSKIFNFAAANGEYNVVE